MSHFVAFDLIENVNGHRLVCKNLIAVRYSSSVSDLLAIKYIYKSRQPKRKETQAERKQFDKFTIKAKF